MPDDESLYDVARRVTDEVLGAGSYAQINAGNPDPGVQQAIQRSSRPLDTAKLSGCGPPTVVPER
jgi:hypothetical protein